MAVPRVSADVALSSLIALGDRHLLEMADALAVVARTEAARAGDWNRIHGLLSETGRHNIDAALWYARPDGTYFTVEHGAEPQRLSHRRYFPKLMAGSAVLGDLVVSKSTGKSVAIVAVPIRGRDGTIVGALGASVYLDRLSARLSREMRLEPGMIFYSFDAEPLLGLAWDPSLIMLDPRRISPEISRVFDDMLGKREGIVRYSFRGEPRTVLFRRSSVTGWWYAFGVVGSRRSS